MAAGLSPAWAVEYDEKIAAVFADNFGHAPIVADVRAVDYSALPAVDWLHASPVCTRASVANAGAVESAEDVETAAAVVRAIQAAGPRVVTIENVWQYRNFAAFRLICDALDRAGYMWTVDHVNAADYGVPQTRRRLFLRAVHGALLPPLPAPVAWVGWYAAIEDLIPDLPDSKLAPWQAARLPADTRRSFLIGGGNASRFRPPRSGDLPAFTIENLGKVTPRAISWQFGSKKVTAAALARLQSFPDSYRLAGSKLTAYAVIGNAVPPLMVERIAAGMLSSLA